MATTTKSYIGKHDIEHWTGATGSKLYSRNTSTGGSLTVRKVGNVVDVIEVHGTGTASQAALAAGLAAAGSDETTLELAQGTWQITSSVAVPATTILHLVSGAVFSVDSGQTLTLNGPIWVDSAAAWYSGDGTVVINGQVISGAGISGGGGGSGTGTWVDLSQYNPTGDGSTDDTAAFTAALAAAGGGGTLIIPKPSGTSYRVDALTIPSNISIIIEPGTIIHLNTGAADTDSVFELNYVCNVLIEGSGATLKGNNNVRGEYVSSGDGSMHGVGMVGCSNITVRGLHSTRMGTDGFYTKRGGDANCQITAIEKSSGVVYKCTTDAEHGLIGGEWVYLYGTTNFDGWYTCLSSPDPQTTNTEFYIQNNNSTDSDETGLTLGAYAQSSPGTPTSGDGWTRSCYKIRLENVSADWCYRQGLSITNGQDVYVRGIFTDIWGASPEKGIDVEPNVDRDVLVNITLDSIYSARCGGGGIGVVTSKLADQDHDYDGPPVSITIPGHYDEGGNYTSAGMSVGNCYGKVDGQITITNPVWSGSWTSAYNGRNHAVLGPRVLIDAPSVIDCNGSCNESERYGSAISIYRETGDTGANAIGNVTVRNPSVTNKRYQFTLTTVAKYSESISAVEQEYDKTFKVTTGSAHGLEMGDVVTITGTTNFNAEVKITHTPATATEFMFTHTNDSDGDETGLSAVGVLNRQYTCTTSENHDFRNGDRVYIDGTTSSTFDGWHYITDVSGVGSKQFRIRRPTGSDANQSGLTARCWGPMLCVTSVANTSGTEYRVTTSTAHGLVVRSVTATAVEQVEATDIFKVTVNADHGLEVGQKVRLSGTTNFDEEYTLQKIPSTETGVTSMSTELYVEDTDTPADETGLSAKCVLDPPKIILQGTTNFNEVYHVLATPSSTTFDIDDTDSPADETSIQAQCWDSYPLDILYAYDLNTTYNVDTNYKGNVQEVYMLDPVKIEGYRYPFVEFHGTGEITDVMETMMVEMGIFDDDLTVSEFNFYPWVNSKGISTIREVDLSYIRPGAPSVRVRCDSVNLNRVRIDPDAEDTIIPYCNKPGDYLESRVEGGHVRLKKTDMHEWSVLEMTGDWGSESTPEDIQLIPTTDVMINRMQSPVYTTSAGAAQDIDTINYGVRGQSVVIVGADGGNTTIKHAEDNILLSGAADKTLADNETLILTYDGTNWQQTGGTDNHA